DVEVRREARVQLDAGLGVVVEERADAPRLRPGEELAHDPAGREDQGILRVDVLGGRRVLRGKEARLAVGEVESTRTAPDRIPRPLLEEARRAGVAFRRARPEDAALALDSLPGDAGVVGDAARGRAPELVEDLARARELEAVWTAEGAGDVLDDAPVGPSV